MKISFFQPEKNFIGERNARIIIIGRLPFNKQFSTSKSKVLIMNLKD